MENYDTQHNRGQWNLGIDRRLYDTEIGELTELMGILDEVVITEEEDRIWWKEDKKVKFSVSVFYS
ncbi:hypothetical protein BVC80_8693g6 [Macleaya cordata]|uniref:Uncharacterized protein n=1 Tax=Macleaya cordata TaxID=56857 RepID=A0A200PS63_MACCD|nr:hypothetical protein BVC80_8693g6 [Macleaya cordata]